MRTACAQAAQTVRPQLRLREQNIRTRAFCALVPGTAEQLRKILSLDEPCGRDTLIRPWKKGGASPLSYGTIPAFLQDYLFGPKDKHDKPVAHASDELISSTEAATGGRAGHQQWHIQEDVLEALAWEPDKENTDEALRRALALIRFLIVRNTIRQAEDKDCAFTTAIVERLSKSRGGSNPRSWPTYSFMLNVLKSIALESPYMPQERRARAAGLVRDGICSEVLREFGGHANPYLGEVLELTLTIFHGLVYGDAGRPLCAAPTPVERDRLLARLGPLINTPGLMGEFRRLLDFWCRTPPSGAAAPRRID